MLLLHVWQGQEESGTPASDDQAILHLPRSHSVPPSLLPCPSKQSKRPAEWLEAVAATAQRTKESPAFEHKHGDAQCPSNKPTLELEKSPRSITCFRGPECTLHVAASHRRWQRSESSCLGVCPSGCGFSRRIGYISQPSFRLRTGTAPRRRDSWSAQRVDVCVVSGRKGVLCRKGSLRWKGSVNSKR